MNWCQIMGLLKNDHPLPTTFSLSLHSGLLSVVLARNYVIHKNRFKETGAELFGKMHYAEKITGEICWEHDLREAFVEVNCSFFCY